jgi:hypothetical protein
MTNHVPLGLRLCGLKDRCCMVALKCTDGYEVRLAKSHAIWHAHMCKIALSGGFLGFQVTIERNFPLGVAILAKRFKERRRTHDYGHAVNCCFGNPSSRRDSDLAIQQELGVLSQRPSRPSCANRVVASSNRPSVASLLLTGLETCLFAMPISGRPQGPLL